MTWFEGYEAGNAGLIQAIKTAEELATMRERKRIIRLLLAIHQNWERPVVLNFRKELFAIIQQIEDSK